MGVFFGRERGPYRRSGPSPLPLPSDCGSSLILGLVPPFLAAALGLKKEPGGTVTAANLHPEVADGARKLASGTGLTLDYQTPAGRTLRHQFAEPRFQERDFVTRLGLSEGDRSLATVELRVEGAKARGLVAFASSVFGGVEILYSHLAQCAAGGRSEIAMQAGVVSAKGTLQDGKALATILESTRSADVSDPGFHAALGFALFPSEGFGFFYGSKFTLEDAPLG